MKITDSLNNEVIVKIQKITPMTTLSYKLERVSSLKYVIIDRGYNSDKYECEIETYGNKTYIDSILAMLQTQRYGTQTGEALVLSDFADNKGEALFGTNVVYTGSISAIVIDTPIRTNKSFNVFSLKFKLRALGLSFEGTPAFPTAMQCIWSGWSGGETKWNRKVNDTFYNDNFVSLVPNDDRKFTGKFICTIEQSKNLLQFYRTIRGSVTTIAASAIGVTTPFGLITDTTYDVIITDLNVEYFSPLYCQATIELTEVGGIV